MDLAAALDVIPNDDLDWDEWNTVGMALYAAALLNSEWRYARGSVAWKGREYRI